MALIEIKRDPSPKDLTVFSAGGGGLCLIAAALTRYRGHTTLAGVLVAVAVGLVLCRLLSRAATRRLYLAFTYATLPIGWTLGTLLMAGFYYGLLLPVGLVFRLIGRDPLQRRWDRRAETYWVPHGMPTDQKRYFQQF